MTGTQSEREGINCLVPISCLSCSPCHELIVVLWKARFPMPTSTVMSRCIEILSVSGGVSFERLENGSSFCQQRANAVIADRTENMGRSALGTLNGCGSR